MKQSCLAVVSCGLCASHAFTIVDPAQRSTTALQMGLFDGVKEAFSAPALERSSLDSERETPIDRWMGWSVVSENEQQEQEQAASDFVDSMDEANYVVVSLAKPMGIVFEENDADFGGIFVQSLKPDGIASNDGTVQVGDQLIAVSSTKVSGLPFDDALGTIIDDAGDTTKLTLFRGSAKQFYGPTGPSKSWLDEFIGEAPTPAPVAVHEPEPVAEPVVEAAAEPAPEAASAE